jgi:hypothetical protein
LLDGTTHAIADAPDVLGGEFAQAWLTRLVMAPFLEAGDDSPQALEQLCRAVTEAGYVKGEEPESQEWLRRAVRLASRSPAEAGLDLKNSKDRWLQHDAGWNFAGWLRRTRGLGWASACFLANALLGYWGWDDGKRNKGGVPYGLNVTRLNHYIARCCQDSLGPSGLLAFSTLQAFHYFTEYLAVHGYFSDDDARRLQSVASRRFETVRGQLDLADPGYALCPTYAALVAADHDQSGGVNPKSILG